MFEIPSFSLTPMPPLVEACCDSVLTARESQAYGAGRIELCGAGDGGTTPSLGLIARCRDEVQIPLHVMIRPRAGNFVYADDEFDVMCNDIVAAKQLGVDGVVIGPLHSDHTIHVGQLVELIALACPMKLAFHRAFDRTPDALVALETLLNYGVSYVLTSGHAKTAAMGVEELLRLQRCAGERLTVLAGGGVRGHNVQDLVARSGVREVHTRATDPMIVRDVVLALTSEGAASPSFS